MRLVLIGGTDAEKQLKELVDFAIQPENWYRPGTGNGDGFVPGDHKPYVRHITIRDVLSEQDAQVRIVFTITKDCQSDDLFRHASVSIGDRSELPDPLTLFTVCKFLGFTGSLDDWHVLPHPDDDGVIVAAQPYKQSGGKT